VGPVRKALTPAEIESAEENLFRSARGIVREKPEFPWHRDQFGAITASREESSQALAVSFFVTIESLRSCDAIFARWNKHFELEYAGPWKLYPEYTVPKSLLGEPRPTQIDVLAEGGGGLILFECKFTEKDGGGCSQPNPLADGAHKGQRQCNGNYEEQVNPINDIRARCALTGKGIRYWDLVPEVMNVDARIDHIKCPFKGGTYQWMRNLVAARALSRSLDRPSAFVLVYADGAFPIAEKLRRPDWSGFLDSIRGRAVPFRSASYQQLLALAVDEATPSDRGVLRDMGAWMEARFLAVDED